MKFAALLAYDVPPHIVARLEAIYGPDMLPVQERAFKELGFLNGGNLVVASTTSSGKSLIAEIAALMLAQAHQRTIFIEPQRALAHEKYEWLRKAYGLLGIRVAIASGEHREFDDDIANGDFHIAVVVVEKLHNLLVTKPRLLEQVGLVVADELQLLGDPSRGATLELLLTKVLQTSPAPRILGLSAVLGRAERLAEWLKAKLLVDARRPVELRKGVICAGRYRYREHNSGNEAVEEFTDVQSDSWLVNLAAILDDLACRRGEQIIVFAADKASTEGLAKHLAGRLRLPPATEAIEELRDYEETHGRAQLISGLEEGVAFHNADLSSPEREIVERHYRERKIRVIFSTTTLAMGMNLPAKNVFIDKMKWSYDEKSGLWRKVDITRGDYENVSGRAGRFSLTPDFGRSFILETSEFNVRAHMRKYVNGDYEPIEPRLKKAPLEGHVLNLVASKHATTPEAVAETLLSSLSGQTFWRPNTTPAVFAAMVNGEIKKCIDAGVVTQTGSGLEATDLGTTCATKGLMVSTAGALARWAQEAIAAQWVNLEVLTVMSLTPDAALIHVKPPGSELWTRDYRELMLTQARAEAPERPLFKPYLSKERVASDREILCFKKALLLQDWIDEMSIKDLEEKYEIGIGTLVRIAQDYSWLTDGLTSIAGAVGWSHARRLKLDTLSRRLEFGVREDAIAIAAMRIPGLERGAIRQIVNAGLKKPEDIKSKSKDELRALVSNGRTMGRLWARFHPESEAPASPPAAAQPLVSTATAPQQAPEAGAVKPASVAAAPTSASVLAVATPGRAPSPVPAPLAAPPPLLERLARAAEAEVPYAGPALRFDKLQHRMWYGDIEVPTSPPAASKRRRRGKKGEPRPPRKLPGYLPPQQFNLLMVLGAKNQGVVRAVELWEKLEELGSLRKPGATPELRNLKHRTCSILRSILCARGVPKAELDHLVVLMPNVGLRLRAGSVEIVGWPETAQQAGSAAAVCGR